MLMVLNQSLTSSVVQVEADRAVGGVGLDGESLSAAFDVIVSSLDTLLIGSARKQKYRKRSYQIINNFLVYCLVIYG